MGHHRGGKGRLRALHDEGNLRAAGSIAENYLPRIRDGKIVLDDITLTKEQIQDLRKVFIVALRHLLHVGVVAKYAFERLLKIPLEVDVASEFRYGTPFWTTRPWSSSSASPARQRIPWPPCAWPRAKAAESSPLSTWWAAPSPTSRTTCCTPGPAGDCRGLHQGLQHPAGRHLYDCPVHGRPAGHRAGGRHGPVHGGPAAPPRLGGSRPGG